MKRSIANTYICIDAEGQTFPIIARTANVLQMLAPTEKVEIGK